MKHVIFVAFALFFVAASPSQASESLSGMLHLAAAQTCQSFQNTCAARCKVRVPDDPDCVSDHCTPKLEECRTTGCWQEGSLYGGKQTCGLVKK